jgi:arylsulfatase A-like enzyme
MMRRFLAPVLFLLVAFDAVRADIRPTRKSQQPNILFILADDLGYGDLGCYGQTKFQTPNIDRLAAEGMRFTQAYAGNTVCAPSRSALMTGLHSGHGPVRSNTQTPLPEGIPTLARVCRAGGLATAAVGKWALGWAGTTGHPNRQGFDEFRGYLDQRAAHNYYPYSMDRNEGSPPWILVNNQNGQRRDYAPYHLFTVATNVMRKNVYAPWFIYFATTIPHANNERGSNGMEVPTLGDYRDKPWPAPERAKASMISRLDDQVGAFVALLKAQNLETNTIIIFTSDNGPHGEGGVNPAFFNSSGGLRGFKRDLYEGGIRVPFIVRWPGRIRPGTTNTLPVAFWDILPTVADLLGVKSPENLDGLSFAPSLFGNEPVRRHESFYWEFHERGYQKAARMGDWKGVKNGPDRPTEVYNLANDPGESKNVAEEFPEVTAKLEKVMNDEAAPFVEPATNADKP